MRPRTITPTPVVDLGRPAAERSAVPLTTTAQPTGPTRNPQDGPGPEPGQAVPARVAVAALLAGAALLLAACAPVRIGAPTLPQQAASPAAAPSGGGGLGGQVPTSTSPVGAPVAATPAGSLASLDPCTVLSPTQLAREGLHQTRSAQTEQGRSCEWQKSASDNDRGFIVGVNLINDVGLDEMSTAGLTQLSDATIGSHRVRRGQIDSLCHVYIGISASSLMDVQAEDGGFDVKRSCAEADDIAVLIEPVLPAAH